jgi:multidrug efflux pump subunit AcrA (membrane-fusion protein)
VAAGVWAYYTNVKSGGPAMDMNMRVTSGNTPFPVVLAPVERGPIAEAVTYTGSVAAFNEEDIYPRVTGRIVEMQVYPGDPVKPGQTVARLDSAELSSRSQEAEAMLATSQANRAQMEADLLASRLGVVQMQKELTMAEAEAGYQQAVAARDEQLFAKGAIAKQEQENSRTMTAVAQAKVQAAQAKLEQSQAMETAAKKRLEAGESMIAQSKASFRTAQIVRDYVTIASPTGGYVVKRLVAPGVLVQPGMPILKIAQIDRVRLQANVGEKDLPSIRVGSPVVVTLAGTGMAPFTARVTSVFPFVDKEGRTAVVEAVVPNEGHRLLPGQYVQMQFETGRNKNAIIVPRGAVVRLGGKATVWILKEDRVEPRGVITGLANPDRVEILQGLGGQERVVVQGHEGLYVDARVSDISGVIPVAQGSGGAHEGMPGMGGIAAKTKEPEKTSGKAMDDMPGHGAGARATQADARGSTEKLQIALVSNPVTLSSGNARLRIEVKDASGAPVSDAKVEVDIGMSGMTVPKATAPAAKEPGIYELTAKLGMGGTWAVEIRASRPQGGTSTAKFNLEAR